MGTNFEQRDFPFSNFLFSFLFNHIGKAFLLETIPLCPSTALCGIFSSFFGVSLFMHLDSLFYLYFLIIVLFMVELSFEIILFAFFECSWVSTSFSFSHDTPISWYNLMIIHGAYGVTQYSHFVAWLQPLSCQAQSPGYEAALNFWVSETCEPTLHKLQQERLPKSILSPNCTNQKYGNHLKHLILPIPHPNHPIKPRNDKIKNSTLGRSFANAL